MDAFASENAWLVPTFWDPALDAFRQDWRRERLLWINAPFSMMGRFVAKLKVRPCAALLLYPLWWCAWQDALEDLAIAQWDLTCQPCVEFCCAGERTEV